MKKIIKKNWLLFLVILYGGFLRFYNLNWDEGHFFHPDERNVANAVAQTSFFDQLNPHFFAYGGLPMYLYRLVGEIFVSLTHSRAWIYDWGAINLVSRAVSAFSSTLSILLIFILVKKISNKKAALLASLFFAAAPSLIQTAHFGVTESLLVFELLLLSIATLNLVDSPKLASYLKTGIVLGMAVATKISALSFLIIPFSYNFIYFYKSAKSYFKFFLLLLAAFFSFTLFSPYAFLDYKKFLESMNYESGVALGKLKVVYVLQFEKTIPYLFQIKNFFWQIGLVTIFGIIGLIIMLIFSLKNKDKKLFALLLFPFVYFFYVGSWYTKFIRYMVPFLPFLIIAAAWLLEKIRQKAKILGKILLSLVIISHFAWSLAFFSVYVRPQTRITASNWIYQNIPKDSKILTEHWDDGLPLPLKRNNPSWYEIEALTIYEPDNSFKINYYSQKLAEADYIIINSRRLYGTLINLPEKYPITSYYYQLLFNGGLGYEKVVQFTSYPSLFGWEINDDSSEETFQVYDHPKVMIFKNQERYSYSDFQKVLNSYTKF